jgi:V-type H+-transporting ATPase subunit C
MVYWLVSLPLMDRGDKERTWSTLQQKTTFDNDWASNFKFDMPELRVGTLDSLMSLSDDLVKTSVQVEGIVGKVRRTIVDVCSNPVAASAIDGVPIDAYLTGFKWDEAKYPSRRSLKETVCKIQEEIAKLDDDLKVRVSEYTALKTAVQGAQRKMQGNLLVRDLSTLVKPTHIVETENLTTLMIAVAKYSHNSWLAEYETLTKFVVPRSSKVVVQDNDYVLCTVTLFRRIVDDFKQQCRSKGYNVRDFTFSPDAAQQTATETQAVQAQATSKLEALNEWCQTAFGDAFSSWIHLCAIRLFTESILRYGLPPKFLPVIMKPQSRSEVKLRASLSSNFGGACKTYWKQDAKEEFSIGYDGEYQPYVSFSINLE